MRKITLIVSALALAQGTALADGMPDVPPPPESDNSCVMQELPTCIKARDERKQAYDSCEQDKTAILDYVRQQCPAFEGKTNDQIVQEAKNPPKPRTGGSGGHHGGGHKPKTPVKPKTTTVIRMERFDAHEGCPAGGLLLSTTTGDKVTDSKVICDGRDGAQGLQGPKGDSIVGPVGPQGPRGLPAESDSGRDGRDGTKVGLGLMVSADVITSTSEPRTFSSAFGLDLRVQHGRFEWSGAALWSPGRDHGTVFKTDLTVYVWKGLGITGGAELIYAGIDDQNKANSQFVLGTLGPTFQFLRSGGWKAQVEAHVSYGAAGAGGAWTSASGGGASGGLVYEF